MFSEICALNVLDNSLGCIREIAEIQVIRDNRLKPYYSSMLKRAIDQYQIKRLSNYEILYYATLIVAYMYYWVDCHLIVSDVIIKLPMNARLNPMNKPVFFV